MAITAGEIRKKYESGFNAIRDVVNEFWLNSAFLRGEQWLWFNPQTRVVDRLPRDPARVQVTVNRLLPSSRTIIGRAVSRHLTFDVLPTAADDATVRGAKLAESVLEDIAFAHDWENLREDCLWAAWKGGTAILAVDWDPARGDTKETVLTIAEVVTEAGTRNLETATWWIKAQAVPPAEVRQMFDLETEPEADAVPGGVLGPTLGRVGGPNARLTMVYTYYERPNSQRPEGVVAVVVGSEIVFGPKPWPFPWKDRLNLAVVRDIHLETHWYGDSTLTSARPVQVALNASWSSIIEHMKLAGNARLMVPYSAMDVIQSMTDTPGEIMPYPDGTVPPQWQVPPQMPAWWIDQPRRLEQELDDLLGVHDVSRGDAPPNIESGYGLSILSEQDMTPITRLVKDTAIAWSKVAQMVLHLLATNVRTPRQSIVRIPGQPPETLQWTGRDLAGQYRAVVPMDAIIPRSRAQMQAFADKAVQMGLVKTVAQYAKLAEMPRQSDIIETVTPDVAKARRENHLLAQGNAVAPETFDDHAVHISEHNDFRKSARYMFMDPKLREIVDMHVQAHETLAAEEAGKQVARQSLSPALATVPTASGSVTTGGQPPQAPPPVQAQEVG